MNYESHRMRSTNPALRSHAPTNEIIIDNFAGGGGASTGIQLGFERLGLKREIAVAINHDGEALAMHEANHPNTKHFQEDVYDVHPGFVTGNRPIGLAWFSPTCTHFSRAKGSGLRDQKIRGLAWVALKWATLQSPRVIMLENVEEFESWGPLLPDLKPDKTQRGRTFQAFVAALSTGLSADHPDVEEIYETLGADFPIHRLTEGLGYAVEWRTLSACDFGAPTTRKRLFLVARRDGVPITWPTPTHAKRSSEAVRLGQLPPWRSAAECIDWSIPCPSIFERKKPLVEATLRRIARGLDKFVINTGDPFIVKFRFDSAGHAISEPLPTITSGGASARPAGSAHALGLCTPTIVHYHAAKRFGDDRVADVDAPLPTQTTENRFALAVATVSRSEPASPPDQQHGSQEVSPAIADELHGKRELVATFMAQHNKQRGGYNPGRTVEQPLSTITGSGSQQQLVTAHLVGIDNQSSGASAAWDSAEPLTTVTTEARHALVSTHLVQMGHGEVSREGEKRWGKGTNSVSEPLVTVTASEVPAALVTSNLVKLRGTNIGQSVSEPLATVSAQGTHHAEVRAFLVKYYGSERDGVSCDAPLHTIRTNDCFGLVMVKGEAYQIVDIGLRMLTPRELARAQGFVDSYILDPEHKGKRLSKTAQVRMIGNSVSPHPAAALVASNFSHEIANSSVAPERVAA